MNSQQMTIRGVLVFFLSLMAAFVWIVPTVQSSNYLEVSFLDVGQGDAIYIVTPDGYELLIDGGPDVSVLSELAKRRSFFDRRIDMVVATHPDSDHISGLVDILKRFEVDYIVESDVEHDTPVAVAFNKAAGAEGARLITAQAGQVIKLGASTTVRILSPQGDTSNWRSNTASIILQIEYGGVKLMLTGDAPKSIEDWLVTEHGETLESEVLKLGHHGSDTSTSDSFLEMVDPEYTIVSASADNRYGHPHREVVARVNERGISMLETSEMGSITFVSDGVSVWQE
tara:strand:- start:1880 stop:2734 length:855 start_codon:yes stop_codon:yes gene_type:complete